MLLGSIPNDPLSAVISSWVCVIGSLYVQNYSSDIPPIMVAAACGGALVIFHGLLRRFSFHLLIGS